MNGFIIDNTVVDYIISSFEDGIMSPLFFILVIYKISNNIGIKQYIVLYSDEDDHKALVEQ